MSGSSCATTGSRTASSHPTRIFWITAAPPGISSPISHGPSCPSACATGHIGSDQRDPVLTVTESSISVTSVTDLTAVPQHFLLSAQARSLSLKTIYRDGEEKAYGTFRKLRWHQTD